MNKRNREVNWSTEEKMLLVEAVKKRRDIIEGKCNDLKMIKNKKIAWLEISEEMKINGFNRELSRIKEMWRRMKCSSKTEVTQYMKSIKKTGGGSPPARPDDINWAIRDICPDDFTEDTSRYDSDFAILPVNMEPETAVENYTLDPCTGILTPILPLPQPSPETSGVDMDTSCPSAPSVPSNSNPTDQPIPKRKKKKVELTSFENEIFKLEEEKYKNQINNMNQIHQETLKNLENENKRQENLYQKDLEVKNLKADILKLKKEKESLEIELLRQKLVKHN